MDFISDHNPSYLGRAADIIGMPDHVAQSAPLTKEDIAGLPDNAFANKSAREYPIHTKTAAWLSCVHHTLKGEADEDTVERLTKAAFHYGIVDDISLLRDNVAKSASEAPSERYALSVDFGGAGGRGVECFYPLGCAGSTLASQRAVLRDMDDGRLPAEWFKKACVEIVKAAKDYGLSDGEIHQIVKQAGEQKLPDWDTAALWYETRNLDGAPEQAVKLAKEIIMAAKEAGDAEAEKFATLLADLDRLAGVKSARDAFTIVFSGMSQAALEKSAAESIIIEGVLVPSCVFASVPEKEIRMRFNKEAADKLAFLSSEAVDSPAIVSDHIEREFTPSQRRELLGMLMAQ